ncbi:MAG TPA: hypothetical protein VE964_19065, partial [Myxococcales bacterium]|nr:hypothetical protein [Myxococcales bacterium]
QGPAITTKPLPNSIPPTRTAPAGEPSVRSTRAGPTFAPRPGVDLDAPGWSASWLLTGTFQFTKL